MSGVVHFIVLGFEILNLIVDTFEMRLSLAQAALTTDPLFFLQR